MFTFLCNGKCSLEAQTLHNKKSLLVQSVVCSASPIQRQVPLVTSRTETIFTSSCFSFSLVHANSLSSTCSNFVLLCQQKLFAQQGKKTIPKLFLPLAAVDLDLQPLKTSTGTEIFIPSNTAILLLRQNLRTESLLRQQPPSQHFIEPYLDCLLSK